MNIRCVILTIASTVLVTTSVLFGNRLSVFLSGAVTPLVGLAWLLGYKVAKKKREVERMLMQITEMQGVRASRWN